MRGCRGKLQYFPVIVFKRKRQICDVFLLLGPKETKKGCREREKCFPTAVLKRKGLDSGLSLIGLVAGKY